jgi:hypothetical protein
MRFKVQRTLLADPTLRPFANGTEGPNPIQGGDDRWWYVEIATLEELMAFTEQHGELVIGTDGTDHYLEIYDSSRER